MHARRSTRLLALCLLATSLAFSWGGTAHRLINKKAVIHLPPAMSILANQQTFLEAHASDADIRKSTDAAESPKHYIDLESYPDFQHLPADLSVLVARFDWSTIEKFGILPWATFWALDSLTAQMRRGNWTTAYQTAADLGHYVGDAYQPLHCTINYDGKLTGNDGIHSRYESGMINAYQSMLTIVPDTVRYLADPFAFILEYTLRSNTFKDSILQGDNAAKAASGWNGSDPVPQAYYAALWERTRPFTSALIQESTVALASLWYTAWVNATQSIPMAVQDQSQVPGGFVLEQNYPNPFNGISNFGFSLPASGQAGILDLPWVTLKIYDLLGREVAVLVNERKEAGSYTMTWDAAGMASGIYFCRLTAGALTQSRRMLLLR